MQKKKERHVCKRKNILTSKHLDILIPYTKKHFSFTLNLWYPKITFILINLELNSIKFERNSLKPRYFIHEIQYKYLI